jgi:glutamyl-tRNA synthetase
MSKRHGAVGVMQYRDDGFLPEALLNYLVRLGWSHGDQELFSMDQLLELFNIEDVSRSPSTFNPEKLLWVNQEKIKLLTPSELLQRSAWHFAAADIPQPSGEYAESVVGLIQERCKTLIDVVEQTRFFFNDVDGYDQAALKKWVKPVSPELLNALIVKLDALEQWTADGVQASVQAVVDEHQVGFAKVAQPVRIAVTGGTMSPSIDSTLALLGREKSMQRLHAGLRAFESILLERG